MFAACFYEILMNPESVEKLKMFSYFYVEKEDEEAKKSV
jgi:hypothetical protein